MSAAAAKSAAQQPPPANSKSVDDAKKKTKKQNKKNSSFGRCLKAPFRALICARDLYVKTLGSCAGAGGSKRGGSVGFSSVLMSRAGSRNTFGLSNRFTPGDNDFMDLVRANSKLSVAAAAAAAEKKAAANAVVVQRCQSSVPGIGRIDEERSCEFDGDVRPGIGLRSQSCTVAGGWKPPRVTV